LLVNLIYKRKKLSLKQLIKKYDLKESHSWKIVNVSDNVDKIAYNI
jgi:hypothetical protein